MGGNLLKTLFTTIKTKMTSIVTKVKRWTNWSYIQTQVTLTVRNVFSKLLDVKPRNKQDYYEIFGWLVSRRLAYAVVVVTILLCVYYLISLQATLVSGGAEGIRTYAYDSIMLRFADEKVRIKGKSGYIAYEGQVKNGSVNGYGILYNPQGTVVYQGNFEKNQYHGSGTRYYDNGTPQYIGTFQANQFEGTGKQYRQNGSMIYEGEFSFGKKEGKGKLYDNGGNLIYTGNFSQDELLYSDLLGKKSAEVAEAYGGKRILYEQDGDFAVILDDISAMYLGGSNRETLDDEMAVERVLVLKNYFTAGGRMYTGVDQLEEYFGTKDFEGNSEVTLAEALSINWLAEKQTGSAQTVDMELTTVLDDYLIVEGFDDTYVVYLYSFHKEGLVYTFVCQDRNDSFSFYSIEQEEGVAVE